MTVSSLTLINFMKTPSKILYNLIAPMRYCSAFPHKYFSTCACFAAECHIFVVRVFCCCVSYFGSARVLLLCVISL